MTELTKLIPPEQDWDPQIIRKSLFFVFSIVEALLKIIRETHLNTSLVLLTAHAHFEMNGFYVQLYKVPLAHKHRFTMHSKNIIQKGRPLEETKKVMIMIHGRGGTGQDILSLTPHLDLNDFTLMAPQAYNNSWYPLSFLAPEEQNQPWLSSALKLLEELETDLNSSGIASENIYFFGFSQGACLTLEYVTRHAKRYGGVIAVIGGLIGENINTGDYIKDFAQTPIFIATSNPDTHVPLERVHKTADILKLKNADVSLKVFENAGHTILLEELQLAKAHVFGASA